MRLVSGRTGGRPGTEKIEGLIRITTKETCAITLAAIPAASFFIRDQDTTGTFDDCQGTAAIMVSLKIL